MTSDAYIEANKTKTLKKGDSVVMHSCYEATFPENYGKLFTCKTNSYIGYGQAELVFLEGVSGCFAVEYLQLVLLN